jgi:hypothetical protein
MKKLPKPNHEYGYPPSQIKEILRKLNIDEKDFGKACGVNTMMLDKETGEAILYECDMERALWKLGHKLGKYHMWD